MGKQIKTNLVEYAINSSKTLTIKTISYLKKERYYVDKILKQYLIEIKQESYQNQLSYCIHELAGNANRANMKRVFFKEKKLDIYNAKSYSKGMELFRNETFERVKSYHAKLKEALYYINIEFKVSSSRFIISVINNSKMTQEENRRVQQKLEIIQKKESVINSFDDLEDFSEGAGFGIVMIYQILESSGLQAEDFKIYTHGEKTISSISFNYRKEDICSA